MNKPLSGSRSNLGMYSASCKHIPFESGSTQQLRTHKCLKDGRQRCVTWTGAGPAGKAALSANRAHRCGSTCTGNVTSIPSYVRVDASWWRRLEWKSAGGSAARSSRCLLSQPLEFLRPVFCPDHCPGHCKRRRTRRRPPSGRCWQAAIALGLRSTNEKTPFKNAVAFYPTATIRFFDLDGRIRLHPPYHRVDKAVRECSAVAPPQRHMFAWCQARGRHEICKGEASRRRCFGWHDAVMTASAQ